MAFWFTALTSVWFFLDDLRKIAVFYVLLLGVPLALAAQTLKSASDRPLRTIPLPRTAPPPPRSCRRTSPPAGDARGGRQTNTPADNGR